MPDICDLILDDHETFRRRFAELDEKRGDEPAALTGVWHHLGALLDVHAAAEEELFYPLLVRRGEDGRDETEDAIGDHNQIRDAVRQAAGSPTGSAGWWRAVERAREANSDHMAEEERGALADLRTHVDRAERADLGTKFLSFKEAHAGGRHLETHDKDPESYVVREAPQ